MNSPAQELSTGYLEFQQALTISSKVVSVDKCGRQPSTTEEKKKTEHLRPITALQEDLSDLLFLLETMNKCICFGNGN